MFVIGENLKSYFCTTSLSKPEERKTSPHPKKSSDRLSCELRVEQRENKKGEEDEAHALFSSELFFKLYFVLFKQVNKNSYVVKKKALSLFLMRSDSNLKAFDFGR